MHTNQAKSQVYKELVVKKKHDNLKFKKIKKNHPYLIKETQQISIHRNLRKLTDPLKKKNK